MEQQLVDAATNGHVKDLQALLRDNPAVDVNWRDFNGWTALHYASRNDHAEVAKLLLAHPSIDVNLQASDGSTSFSFGCVRGAVSVVIMLLKDHRVDVSLDNVNGFTPLLQAASWGQYEVIEWLIASGRDLAIHSKGRECGKDQTALAIARQRRNIGVVSLLERFVANPALTRRELRVKFGVLDGVAAEIFAAMIFLCDELLQIRRTRASHQKSAAADATRFLVIAKKLPMELQMVLSYRVVGSRKMNVLRRESEAAFKDLARILLLD